MTFSWNCVTLSENSSKSFALWWTRAGLLVFTLKYPLLCAPTIFSGEWRLKNGCRSGRQAQGMPRDGSRQDHMITSARRSFDKVMDMNTGEVSRPWTYRSYLRACRL